MRLSLNEAPPRLSMAMLLAVPLVYLLFLGASWLVKVDEVVLAEKADRPLGTITPAEKNVELPSKALEIDTVVAAKPPPIRPPAIETKGDVGGFTFEPPAIDTSGLSRITPPSGAVTPLTGRNIQVVRSPAPSIPAIAIERGISGSCDVFFDVDTRGRPFNLSARCTEDVFIREAIRSVGKAEFLPKINAQGIAVEQHGAIYPLVFEVN
jgi:periplasmic protein TonB